MWNTWNSIKNFPKKYIQMLKELLDWVLEVINDDDFRKKTKEEARHAFLYLILSAV
jgi:hypothetical protein